MARAATRRKPASRPSQPRSFKRRQRRPNAHPRQPAHSKSAVRARRKFLRVFPQGFRDETYVDWERGYKWAAHQRWNELLAEGIFRDLIENKKFSDIAVAAIRIESRTNLLFSFKKMALRDACGRPRARRCLCSRCSISCTAPNRWKSASPNGSRRSAGCRASKHASLPGRCPVGAGFGRVSGTDCFSRRKACAAARSRAPARTTALTASRAGSARKE